MAHFAQLDDNNQVIQVIVVNNEDLLDGNGVEQEGIGITFCTNLFGADTRWVQTSYNGNIRKNYAGIGFTYDDTRDAFIPPQPYASWTLNETTCQWDAPVPRPASTETTYHVWNEDNQQWVKVNA